MSDPQLEMTTAALVAMAEHGIPPDVIELMIHGNPSRGIAPKAILRVVQAIVRTNRECRDPKSALR